MWGHNTFFRPSAIAFTTKIFFHFGLLLSWRVFFRIHLFGYHPPKAWRGCVVCGGGRVSMGLACVCGCAHERLELPLTLLALLPVGQQLELAARNC